MRSPATLTDGAVRPVSPLDELRAAVATLTRIPAGVVRADVSGAAVFGLVGALVGLVGALPLVVLGALDGASLPASVLAIALVATVTGAFHLDGLADTADALVAMGPTAAERARKDPTLGTGGVVAVVSVLLLEVTTLDALVRAAGPIVAAAVLVTAAAGSRAFAVGVAFAGRGRAVGDGMGARFAASVGWSAVAVAGGSALAVALLATTLAGSFAPTALVGGVVAASVVVVLVVRARRQLDGDGLGAAVELAFAAILLAGVVAVAWPARG